MHGYGWMAPMGAGMVGWLLAIALIIGFAVWLAVRYAAPRGSADSTTSARRILAERYARGELDTDEYTRRLAELR